MKESSFERRLVKRIKDMGGLCLKFTAQKGVPDRIVLLPDGKICFIELKAEGEKPRLLQLKWIEILKNLGFVAGWADNMEEVMSILGEL